MIALSTWQPWAHLIAAEAKGYETRSWATFRRGEIAIHASAKWTRLMYEQCLDEPFRSTLESCGVNLSGPEWTPRGLDFGAVVAVADLVNVVPTADLLPTLGPQEIAFGDFTHGRWAWRFENVVRLREPVYTPGRQGLFELPNLIGELVDHHALRV